MREGMTELGLLLKYVIMSDVSTIVIYDIMSRMTIP